MFLRGWSFESEISYEFERKMQELLDLFQIVLSLHVICNSCAIRWDLLDLLPFPENHRISWCKFLSSYNFKSYLDTHPRPTYFLVLTWVQVQYCKNSYYFSPSNVSVSSKTDHTPPQATPGDSHFLIARGSGFSEFRNFLQF